MRGQEAHIHVCMCRGEEERDRESGSSEVHSWVMDNESGCEERQTRSEGFGVSVCIYVCEFKNVEFEEEERHMALSGLRLRWFLSYGERWLGFRRFGERVLHFDVLVKGMDLKRLFQFLKKFFF